jgi:hypothetical protein
MPRRRSGAPGPLMGALVAEYRRTAGKQIVFDLVSELGFDPVDGGTLAESWRQQPGTPVYGTDLDAQAAVRALAAASPARSDAFRAAG